MLRDMQVCVCVDAKCKAQELVQLAEMGRASLLCQRTFFAEARERVGCYIARWGQGGAEYTGMGIGENMMLNVLSPFPSSYSFFSSEEEEGAHVAQLVRMYSLYIVCGNLDMHTSEARRGEQNSVPPSLAHLIHSR